MPVRDVIAAATSVAASEVRLPGRIGTLAPGAQADFLVVDGHPLHDLETLERVALVIVERVPLHSASSHPELFS